MSFNNNYSNSLVQPRPRRPQRQVAPTPSYNAGRSVGAPASQNFSNKPTSPEQKMREFGREQVGFYDQRRDAAQEYWNPLERTANQYEAERPSHVANLYGEMRSMQKPGARQAAYNATLSTPSYMEGFAQTAMTGSNPAYDYLKNTLQKDLARSTAARGTFGSGRAMARENDALTTLAAKEYMNRAQIAQMGDQARNARLGLTLDAAGAADQGDYDYMGMLMEGAKGATGETSDYFDRILGARAQLGQGRVGTAGAYDMAAGDTRTEAELAALDAEWQRQMAPKQPSRKRRFLQRGFGLLGMGTGGVLGGPQGAAHGGQYGAGQGDVYADIFDW